VLQNQNLDIGRLGSISVPDAGEQKGKWKLLLPLQEGQNTLKVYIKGWDEVNKELAPRGFSPKLQWPVGKKDKDTYVPNLNTV
jgi:hypothetical protein